MPDEQTQPNVAATTGQNPIDAWVAQADEVPATPEETKPEVTGEAVEPQTQANAEPATPDAGAQEPEKRGDEDPVGVQKKIDKLTRMRREAEEEAARIRAEADELRRRLDEKEAAGQGAKPKPQLHEFDTHEAWTEALTDWKYEERERQRNLARMAELETKAKEARQTKAKSIADEGMARYQDFQKVAFSIPISEPMLDAIAMAEDSVDVVYHLGNNQEEAIRIANMPPVRQIYELAKLDLKLAQAKEQALKAKTVSTAPAPIAPLKGGGEPPERDLDKIPIDEYMRLAATGQI